MNILAWIIAGVLALAFLAAGLMKITQPKAKLATNMAWVNDFSAGMVKFIGVAEVLGALGLILPQATGIAPALTPLAAVGLAIIMVGAIITHARRKEPQMIIVNVVLLVLCLLVAVLRFVA
jgi:uncharacterized membrane protein YphA (DoxX/SURF4 family)